MARELPPEIGLPKVKTAAERALSLDPREIEAHYRLALYSFHRGDAATGTDHMRRAQELEPDNPVLLATRSLEALAQGSLDEAVQLQQRAVAGAPLNLSFRYNLANTLYVAGRFDESVQAMREVLEMDANYRADILAYIWILRGQYQEAVQLARSWTDTPDKWESLALAYFGLGALNESDRALTVAGGV
ncbi:MAG: tetratricopeptide repeat protein [Steroidobacteraceae bacterium]